MHDVNCDHHGRLRELFHNWCVRCRDCGRWIPVIPKHCVVFAISYEGGKRKLTDARMGDHDLPITPELERRLLDAADDAARLGLREIMAAQAEAAATK